jgi:phosphoglycerate dehydrogenase-like enzyme
MFLYVSGSLTSHIIGIYHEHSLTSQEAESLTIVLKRCDVATVHKQNTASTAAIFKIASICVSKAIHPGTS